MPGGIETPGEPRKKRHSFFRRPVNDHRDLMPGQPQEGTPSQPPQPSQPTQPPQPVQPPQPPQPSQTVPGTAEQETQTTAPQQTDLTGQPSAGTGAAETGRSGQHAAGTEDTGGKTEKQKQEKNRRSDFT